jgi:hypothetical protein
MACATSARAGMKEGDGELGFDFGATVWDEDLGGKSGVLLKLRGGYNLTRHFEIEGQAGYSAYFYGPAVRNNNDFTVYQSMVQAFLSGVVNFPSRSGNVIPYVLAGAGATHTAFHAYVNDTSTAWMAGGGSRFFFGERKRTAFRLEAAYLFDQAFEQSNRNLNLAMGFVWRLGD